MHSRILYFLYKILLSLWILKVFFMCNTIQVYGQVFKWCNFTAVLLKLHKNTWSYFLYYTLYIVQMNLPDVLGGNILLKDYWLEFQEGCGRSTFKYLIVSLETPIFSLETPSFSTETQTISLETAEYNWRARGLQRNSMGFR